MSSCTTDLHDSWKHCDDVLARHATRAGRQTLPELGECAAWSCNGCGSTLTVPDGTHSALRFYAIDMEGEPALMFGSPKEIADALIIEDAVTRRQLERLERLCVDRAGCSWTRPLTSIEREVIEARITALARELAATPVPPATTTEEDDYAA